MREKFYRLNEDSRLFLSRGYINEGQIAEDRILEIANNAEKILGIKGFADKFYDYMSKGYYSLSSPVRANFGKDKGLPISCNTINIQDSVTDIMKCVGELGVMSKNGAGVGTYFGNIRSRGESISGGGTSSGSVFFMEMFDKVADCISQSGVRRGFTTPYLPADHGDIEEFIDIGSEGHPIQRCTTAVVIPEGWMEDMIDGDKYKRKIRAKIIEARISRGYPYIMFKSCVNENTPKCYKDNNMIIESSNICSECLLHTDENHSFVCCLSSINLFHWDEIKDTDAVETLTFFLDAVMQEYIDKIDALDDDTKFYMRKARNAAFRERALGLGGLGWHHYLQSKMIAFESEEAININKEIWKTIRERSEKTSREMAKMFGEPELLKGYGLRNSFTLMIAPTTSSAFILGGVSQSIEPLFSNYYTKDLAKTKVTIKNKYLEEILKQKKINNKEIRDSIRDYDGSVQHLDELTHDEKMVFKTFREIDQQIIINQAADRQVFIDQGQSLNLMITPSYTPKEISNLLIDAWKKGIKTLYYQHSVSGSQEVARNHKQKIECVGCSG